MSQQQPIHDTPSTTKLSHVLVTSTAFVITFLVVGLLFRLWLYQREHDREQVRAVLQTVGMERWFDECLVGFEAREWNGDGTYFCRLDIPPNDVDKLLAPFRTEVWKSTTRDASSIEKLDSGWWQPKREQRIEVTSFQPSGHPKCGSSTYTIAVNRTKGHVYVHVRSPG